MNFHRLKKALIISAFFIGALLSPAAQSNNKPHCAEFVATETADVRYIHDGDTLFLSDNRKLRLIGIDTPELISKYNKAQPIQPFAMNARDFARELIQQFGSRVKLMPGIESADRYGRQLFHIQLADGSLLQSRLLQAGLAVAYTTPPNQQLSHCYHHDEQIARQQGLKIWSLHKYKITSVSALTPKANGFHLIRGRVRHIGESKKAFWINFYGDFSARIDKRDMAFFLTPFEQLLEKEITVRGWLHQYKNKTRLSLRHPSAIER